MSVFWARLLKISAAVIIIFLISMFVSSIFVVSGMFKHRVEKFTYTPEDLGLSGDQIHLMSDDGIELAAWHIPHPDPKGVVIVLHGMDGIDASSLMPHARFLFDAGYESLLLDMRAHGYSGGDRIGLAFEEPSDVEAAINWVKANDRLESKRLTLLGLSMGGATAIRSAAQNPDVDAVISSCSFASIDRMISQGMRLMGSPEWMITIFSPFSRLGIAAVYGAWPANASPLADIDKIAPRPILIMHGNADSQIPVENAYALKEKAGENAELWIVEGADHLIFTEDGIGDQDQAYRLKILAFLDEFGN